MVCKRSPSSYIRAGVTRILWIWRHDAKDGSQLVYIPQLLFRVKKEWLDTRKDIPDWSRVRIASFFTRCISPGSSATPCLIWLRWRLGPLHTDSYAGIPTNHNYLNISTIRKMLANSYIISKRKVWSPFRLIHGGCGKTCIDKLLILHTRIDMKYQPT